MLSSTKAFLRRFGIHRRRAGVPVHLLGLIEQLPDRLGGVDRGLAEQRRDFDRVAELASTLAAIGDAERDKVRDLSIGMERLSSDVRFLAETVERLERSLDVNNSKVFENRDAIAANNELLEAALDKLHLLNRAVAEAGNEKRSGDLHTRFEALEAAVSELKASEETNSSILFSSYSSLHRRLNALPANGHARGSDAPFALSGNGHGSSEIQRKAEFDFMFEADLSPRSETIVRRRKLLELAQDAVSSTGGAAPVVDLGCGRGEWLEVLTEAGLPCLGVDVESRLTVEAEGLGLPIVHAQPLDWLKGQDGKKYAMLSAFGLLEKLPFCELSELIFEAYRVLRPGGVFLFEALNPENLNTASNEFYASPGRSRPMPPELGAKLLEYRGFENIQTVFVDPHPKYDMLQRQMPEVPEMLRMLFGPRRYIMSGVSGEVVS